MRYARGDLPKLRRPAILENRGKAELSADAWQRHGTGRDLVALRVPSAVRHPVAHDARSWMNIPFTLAKPELDKTFTTEAKDAGLVTLEGHRSVGGFRASIYNAFPEAGVDALVQFMQEFERKNG